MDAQLLRKKLGRASGEAARTLLGSLLLYILDRTEEPLRVKDGEHRTSCPALPPEASRRPTRFQLLQAKFMGRGREPPLKRTREVGRLISKDRQGPSRSFVNATISKLLEKAQGNTSSPSQRPTAREKSRYVGPGGKSTVKTILKKFLAAEEKEAKEKGVQVLPQGPRPGATRGPLPRVGSRGTILSKLREKFEQSSCLYAEASVLPLRKEDRKSRTLQKRTHRPEVRVLHVATMATSCTRTPPARFLACTAEPLPALSIATVVGSPQGWLSRCAKISHSDARHQAKTEASLSPGEGHTETGRNEIPGMELLSKDSREQWEPSKSSKSQGMAPGGPHAALSTAGASQTESSCAFLRDRALPGHLPAVALLGPANPGGARPAAGQRTVEPIAAGATDHIQGVGEGAGEGPQVIMTVSSSEDEAESALSASKKEPLFATQQWLPKLQQEAEAHLPPAPPVVQAAQRTQPGMVSPQITVKLPVILEMPAPPVPQTSTLSHTTWCLHMSEGEAVMDRVTPDRRDAPALARLSKPGQMPESPLSPELGPQEALKDAANMNFSAPQTVLTPKPPSSLAGKVETASHPGPSGPSLSAYSGELHALLESNETQTSYEALTSHHAPAWENQSGGGSHPASAPAPAQPAPQNRGSLLAIPQDYRQPESCPSVDQSNHCGQEECPWSLTQSALPLGAAPGSPSQDLWKNKQSWLGDQPETGIPASRETAVTGNIPDPTVPLAGAQKMPLVAAQMVPQADAKAMKNKAAELATLEERGGRAVTSCPCATAGKGLPGKLAPSGPSVHTVGATEGSIQGWPQVPTWVPPTAHSEDATDSCQALTVSRLCASSGLEASTPHASEESKGVCASEEGTLCNSVTSQTPTARHSQKSLGCDLGEPWRPSAEPQAPDPWPSPDTAHPPTCPAGQAPTQEARPAQLALELPAPDQQADHRTVPNTKRAGPAPAGLGPSESHCGPVHSQQTEQQDSSQTMAAPLGQKARGCKTEPWDPGDLSGNEMPTTQEKPGTAKAQEREHLLGPRVRQDSSPTQGDSTQAVGTPAAQSQGRAGGIVAQARGQPGTLAKEAPTANASRDPLTPGPNMGSLGSPGTRSPSKGDKGAAACPSEPMASPAPPVPDMRSHQAPQAKAQVGAPDTLGTERNWADCKQHRRLVHFSKYKAQSFRDQRAFDLSFRPRVLRASDTFEAPK